MLSEGKFPSLLLCIKTAQKSECLYEFIALSVIIPHSSIFLAIPVAFIYKFSLSHFVGAGAHDHPFVLHKSMRDVEGVSPYNKFFKLRCYYL